MKTESCYAITEPLISPHKDLHVISVVVGEGGLWWWWWWWGVSQFKTMAKLMCDAGWQLPAGPHGRGGGGVYVFQKTDFLHPVLHFDKRVTLSSRLSGIPVQKPSFLQVRRTLASVENV